jgi:hypothetical protein
MDIANRTIQAYRQAPWRQQLQWGGMFLLVLVAGLLIAGVYLNISAQAATAGLETQDLSEKKEETLRAIANNRTKLAQLTSQAEMEKRAAELGFVDATREDASYLVVEGYGGRQPIVLAPTQRQTTIEHTLIKPVYTQSLWEWMFQGVLSFSETNTAGGQ